MIEAKETLVGEINSKVTLEGKLDVGVFKAYPELENLVVTPNSEEQVFNHENSYGYDEVRVEAIPNTYIEPTGTLEITENGEYNVRELEKAKVDVITGYILNIEGATINFSKGANVNGNEVVL